MRYVVRRLISSVFVILGVGTVVFIVLRLAGDPTALLLTEGASQANIDELRFQLGLDQPVSVQYLRFLKGVFTLDFGRSFRYNEPAIGIVLERLPATLQLALMAMLIGVVLGVPLGVASAVRRNSIFDSLASFVAFLGQAIPNFWLGIMFILFFAVELRWLPTSGSGTWKHLILPAVTLATRPFAEITRITRSEMIETLKEDYIRTARSKGLSERYILRAHALRNAAIPLVTVMALNLGALLGGAIVVETVFAWPGAGRLLVQAIQFRDFPLVQADVLFLAGAFVVINFFADILYTSLDPRIELG